MRTALTMRTISRFSSSVSCASSSRSRFCWAEIFSFVFSMSLRIFSTVAMCAKLLSKSFSPGIVPPQALDRFQVFPGIVLQRQGAAEQIGMLLPQGGDLVGRSEEHTSELQSRFDIVCRLLLEKQKSFSILCAAIVIYVLYD